MRAVYLLLLLLIPFRFAIAEPDSTARYVETPYSEPKVVFDFYFDEPNKIDSALYWVRSLVNPLMEEPYGMAPDFMDIIIIIHGTEIVTVAKKNYPKYKNAVDRLRYYTSFGAKVKVCALAAKDFDYAISDFQDFIEVVPSAITELVYWQQQGYAVIKPEVIHKKYSNDQLR